MSPASSTDSPPTTYKKAPRNLIYYLGLALWLLYFTFYAIINIGMCIIYAVIIPVVQPRNAVKVAEKENIRETEALLAEEVKEMSDLVRGKGQNAVVPGNEVTEALSKAAQQAFPHPSSFWVILLLLPTNLFSKFWGLIESVTLPRFLRAPLFELWASSTGCKLDEMTRDIHDYTCLDDFFTRKLRPECRPIDEDSDLVSPCDAKVLSFGELDGDKLRHVKGYEYPLEVFLGKKIFQAQFAEGNGNTSPTTPQKYLNHVVFYLSPGDCHRYVSPTTWTAQHRTHFPGALYTVAPMMLKYISGLFAINERVILSGYWNPKQNVTSGESDESASVGEEEASTSTATHDRRHHHRAHSTTTDPHNRFVMALVGAMNVGSIELKFDNIRTNSTKFIPDMGRYDVSYAESVSMEKGEEIGTFHLGSTIVLIFETDEPFQFAKNIRVGEKVQYGQRLRK